MRRSRLTFVLYIVAAVFFGASAVVQFVLGNVAFGVMFTVLTAINVALVTLIRSGRLPGA